MKGGPAAMTVSRLRDIPGIGVDAVGDAADAAADPDILRLENLDTDLRPPRVALEMTRAAIDDDAANSYLGGGRGARRPPGRPVLRPGHRVRRRRGRPQRHTQRAAGYRRARPGGRAQ